MRPIKLETERLILRPWTTEDAEDMYEYAKDPDVGLNAGWPPHKSEEESREIIAGWLKELEKGEDDLIVLALELKENGKVIGSLSIEEDSRRKVPGVRILGYALGKAYWGRGLMTEAAQAALDLAFGSGSVNMMTITHFPENLRSKRVIEKCGFRYEGTLRGAALHFDGAVKDLCCYSLTKEEYEQNT